MFEQPADTVSQTGNIEQGEMLMCQAPHAGQAKDVQGLMLEELHGWKFWRFDMKATLDKEERQLHYSLAAEGLDKRTT